MDDVVVAIPPMRPAEANLPDVVISELREFMLDGHTGNVVLNFRDGKLLGYKIEKLYSCKS